LGQPPRPVYAPPQDCPAPLVPVPGQPVPPATSPTAQLPPAVSDRVPTEPAVTAPPAGGSTADTGGETLSIFDSSVGYIDNAIPGNVFRFRFDDAFNLHRPSRAEYFYAKGGPGNPGLPLPEKNVDHQDFLAYLEYALLPRFSIFAEGGARLLNPEVNANAGGATDMIAGFKYAFFEAGERVATFQLKTYIPTGDAGRGLGTNHVSLEPGLLYHQRLLPRLAFDGELKYWIPIGGTDFAGEVFEFGVGLTAGRPSPTSWWFTPVTEVVGWAVVSGKELVVAPSGIATPQDASGNTIVNLKVGGRLGWADRGDVYVGYGRALTGNQWYSDILRVELRLYY
jgi:hypothetical protein